MPRTAALVSAGCAAAFAVLSTMTFAGTHNASGQCKARVVGTAVEVACPRATVAEFLAVMQRATGLRSEYPQEFASTPVSLQRPAAPLLEVLGSALSGFNFMVWVGEDRNSTVTIVERRGQNSTGDAQYGSQLAGGAVPMSDALEQSAVRDDFAGSVTDAMPLEPPVPDPAAALTPTPAPQELDR